MWAQIKNAAGIIVPLILVSGAIAYFGDIIGRRLGKRRLSLFGLRPRYTAIVFSVVAGMIITVVTIAAMLLVSENARLGLLRGRQLSEQNQQLEGQRQSLAAELETSRQEIQQVQSEAKTAVSQRDVAEHSLQQSTTQLATTRSELGTRRKELGEARKNLEEARRNLTDLRQQYQQVQSQLAQAQEELKQSKQALEEERQKVQTQIAADTRTLEALEKEVSQREQRVADLQAQLEDLGRAIQAWDVEVQRLNRQLAVGRVIFNKGQEIVRGVIPAGLGVEEVRQKVRELLARAERQAREAGAAAPEGQAAIVPLLGIERYTLEQIVSAVADSIVEANTESVVQVIAASNALEGEPTVIELRPYNNRLLFSRGQALAQVQVAASDTDQTLFDAFYGLLRKAAAVAREKGIMPGAQEVPTGEIFRAIDAVHASTGKVWAAALAAEEIRTAGPLNLTIQLSGEPVLPVEGAG